MDSYYSNSETVKPKSNKVIKKILLLVVIAFLVTIGFWFGFFQGKKSVDSQRQVLPLGEAVIREADRSDSRILDFSLFWSAYDFLKDKYIDTESVNSYDLLYGSIKGLFKATGDPYTVFLDPEESKKFDEEISGSFEGIGAELGIKNNILTVIAPLEGSPADKSGLRAGDKIIAIDDESTVDMNIFEAVDKIRGPKGTEVKLTVFREGEKDTREVSVERDVINVKSVSYEIKDDDIAYIKISRFADDTVREFSKATNDVLSKGVKALIIDLRNNPGGFLDASIDVAGKFIPKDKVVVIEETKDGSQKKVHTEGGDRLSRFETVVLINEGSASASEILAGAMRDNRDNVTIVGEISFGKGSVQELVELPQGTAAKITVARWLTPNGEQINDKGIVPDVEVDLTDEDYNNDRDPQLDKALEILKSN